MPYFAVSINYENMQSIQANNYKVHFNQNAYEALNNHLKENKYSNLFIIVDNETNEHCLPKFLPLLETDLTIEIVEFEFCCLKNSFSL